MGLRLGGRGDASDARADAFQDAIGLRRRLRRRSSGHRAERDAGRLRREFQLTEEDREEKEK